MSDKTPTPTPEGAADGGKKKNPMLMYGIAAVVVLGGGGGYWWTARAKATEAHETKEEKPVAARERGVVSFQPFVVNLADTDKSRYLRVNLQLVLKDAVEAKEFEETPVAMSQARSSILELLTTKTSGELVTAEGKTMLREEIKERVSKALGEMEVIDVLFSDFVVQF